MQRFVDNTLAVTKESVKTFTYESLNNIVRLINGVSALLLTLLPGKATILEGIQGWEVRPTFRGPRFPRWMENGVSSFNQFIHELSVDSDTSSLEYSSGDEDSDGYEYPESPSSQGSRASIASLTDYGRRQMDWIQYILLCILVPIKFLLGIPFRLFQLAYSGVSNSKPPSTSGNHHPSQSHSYRRMQSLKDQIIHRATDRRRGVIEDLHLAMEIFIESTFDIVRKAAHLLLSPSEAFGALFRLFSSHERGIKDDNDGVEDASFSTPRLGENDPTPTERNTSFRQSLNTDARTCQDVITELGYPYEAIHVITTDGYVLLLERIPRRDSRKAVYLQHGVLDSSMGWVSNGVVGSPAFAAYDQGYDVFLGNFRGLVSRGHTNKNISSLEYWHYSINEHGTEDIPAMIEKIHQVKTAELKLSKPGIEDEINDDQLYKLCAISHSLGGGSMLMYVITRRIEEKPHRLSRLVLLSPAGFHHDSNLVFSVVEHVLFLAPFLSRILPAFYIPTRFFRMLVNKLARDLQNLPAVGELVQTLMGYVVGGDSSNWVGVLGLPHYNMNDMPGISFYVALHLAQIKRTRRFRMFDYGSAHANMEVYGSPEPLDLGEHYRLIDIPVDLVAGHKDTVIRPSMVKRHYKLMKEAGVDVSYNEFEYAHLDFTFSHIEELLSYIMSRLLLVEPNPKHQVNQRTIRSRKKR
ncbi:AB-hydrolase lipase domain [Sesbania bispinosa]|nr:AB-hydrolase lipase domain [Sesbania bispinosa]